MATGKIIINFRELKEICNVVGAEGKCLNVDLNSVRGSGTVILQELAMGTASVSVYNDGDILRIQYYSVGVDIYKMNQEPASVDEFNAGGLNNPCFINMDELTIVLILEPGQRPMLGLINENGEVERLGSGWLKTVFKMILILLLITSLVAVGCCYFMGKGEGGFGFGDVVKSKTNYDELFK